MNDVLDSYLRAKDMWQVKHLKGLTLVSNVMDQQWRCEPSIDRLTGEDVSFEMLIPGKGMTTVGTEDHDGEVEPRRV